MIASSINKYIRGGDSGRMDEYKSFIHISSNTVSFEFLNLKHTVKTKKKWMIEIDIVWLYYVSYQWHISQLHPALLPVIQINCDTKVRIIHHGWENI